MIKFHIRAIGKLKSNSPIAELISDYKKRIVNNLEIVEIDNKKSANLSIDSIKYQESGLLLSNLPTNSYLISMDETGDLLTSKQFASFIEQKINAFSSFVFFIGGADGLHEKVRSESNKVISLGKMTLPHMLARLILIEQIYRAERIMSNHPYNK